MTSKSRYTGQGPCEFYDCPLAAHCKAQRVACKAYLHFVATGSVMHPSKYKVNRCTTAVEADGMPKPSRNVYDEIFNSRRAA